MTAMNPEVSPQDLKHESLPTYPAGRVVVQSTATVNVITESPKDHIIWSLCCFIYSNPFCLGLAALIFSIKSRDRKVVGDLEGARHYGSTARTLNLVSSILVGLGFLILIVGVILLQSVARLKFHR